MKVDENLIKHIAFLARLELTDKEVKEFAPQLKEILESFKKLDKADTKNTEISLHPIPIKNRIREDETTACLSQDEALSLTEHKKDGYFKGPKIV
ncbi:MAG: Asp-tRNA(Asn)/Glu-tRNA(Gln) amidotransferase subunit GatC [Candidatus Woesearchaeota archaeon]